MYCTLFGVSLHFVLYQCCLTFKVVPHKHCTCETNLSCQTHVTCSTLALGIYSSAASFLVRNIDCNRAVGRATRLALRLRVRVVSIVAGGGRFVRSRVFVRQRSSSPLLSAAVVFVYWLTLSCQQPCPPLPSTIVYDWRAFSSLFSFSLKYECVNKDI